MCRLLCRKKLWEQALLERMADEMGATVDEDEVIQVVTKAASAAGLRGTEVRASLMRGENIDVAALARRMRLNKALDSMIEQTKVLFD